MSVLITDANGVASLAILRSLGKRQIEVTAASARKDSIGFYSRYAKRKLVYPNPMEEDKFFKWVYNTLSENKYDVFFPIDEPILMLVAKYKEKLSKYSRIPLPDLQTLIDVTDKSRLSRISLENKIPIPKTYFYDELINFEDSDFLRIMEEFGTPVIIKPNIGSGSRGQVLIYEPKKLEETYKKQVKQFGPCMIQEFLRGTRYSMSAIFNFNSEPRRVCIAKVIRQLPIYGGTIVYGVTIKNNNILKVGLELLRKIKYKSVVDMDFIVDDRDNTPKLLDINPRFFGSLFFPIAAGVDYPYLLYKMSLNGDIDRDLNYEVGVHCRNIFDDFKHLLIVFNKGKTENYNFTRFQTTVNFFKFYKYKNYILSVNDPIPFFYSPISTLKRKLRFSGKNEL